MKKMIAALCCSCAFALAANAQNAAATKKHEMTAEQKEVHKDMLAKYDANKDGKLEKAELAKMTPQDKAKWEKAFPEHNAAKHKKD